MRIDQYLVTFRIDIAREDDDSILDSESIGKTAEDYTKRHYLFTDVEMIESEYIGTLDDA